MGIGPIFISNTTRLPGRIESPPSITLTRSQGGVKRARAPGLSWNAKTTSGGASIRDSLTNFIKIILENSTRSPPGGGRFVSIAFKPNNAYCTPGAPNVSCSAESTRISSRIGPRFLIANEPTRLQFNTESSIPIRGAILTVVGSKSDRGKNFSPLVGCESSRSGTG